MMVIYKSIQVFRAIIDLCCSVLTALTLLSLSTRVMHIVWTSTSSSVRK